MTPKERHRAEVLLTPAFSDPKLARLLVYAASCASLYATATGSPKAKDMEDLFDLVEQLKLENTLVIQHEGSQSPST